MSRISERNFWVDEPTNDTGHYPEALRGLEGPPTFIEMQVPDMGVFNMVCRSELCAPPPLSFRAFLPVSIVRMYAETFEHGTRIKKSDGTKVFIERQTRVHVGKCDKCGTAYIIT